MKLHLEGRLPYDRLVQYYDFADLPAALADAGAGRVLKPILRVS